VDVDCGLIPVLNQRVMIYDTDNRIEYWNPVEIVPFRVIETKRRVVRVRSVNMKYTPRRSRLIHPAAILKFDPGQPRCFARGQRPIYEPPLLNAILNDRDADAGSLERDRLPDLQCASPSGRSVRYGYGVAIGG